MKRIIGVLLVSAMLLGFGGCGKEKPEPELANMKSICELAVMDCYYHNVAKYEYDGSGILWWNKDRRFWVEYSGIVRLGIDASLVEMSVDGTTVTITLPEAKIMGCSVDSTSLNEDSFIVEDGSAKISAEDEVEAFAQAQAQLEAQAAADTAMLFNARERAKDLLGEYVMNFGEMAGVEYTIEWVYLDGDTQDPSADETPSGEADE